MVSRTQLEEIFKRYREKSISKDELFEGVYNFCLKLREFQKQHPNIPVTIILSNDKDPNKIEITYYYPKKQYITIYRNGVISIVNYDQPNPIIRLNWHRNDERLFGIIESLYVVCLNFSRLGGSQIG